MDRLPLPMRGIYWLFRGLHEEFVVQDQQLHSSTIVCGTWIWTMGNDDDHRRSMRLPRFCCCHDDRLWECSLVVLNIFFEKDWRDDFGAFRYRSKNITWTLMARLGLH